MILRWTRILIFLSFVLSLGVGFAQDKGKTDDATKAADSERPKGEGLFNKLLAPGPLISGHEKLEGSGCLECHSPRAGIPNENCLNCHKEIKQFVDNKTGFHGKHLQTCMECHADHQGRNFDTTSIDEEVFEHKETGFILEGKHAKIKCIECHTQKRSEAKKLTRTNDTHYLGASKSCVSCHRKDDVHKFRGKWAKEDCSKCHGLKTWKTDIKFNHRKATGYNLEGKHAEAKCAKCHVPNIKKPSIYKWSKLKAMKCMTCHQDIHGNNLSTRFKGGDCAKCHEQKTWKITNFKHAVTGYPLRGKHDQIKCIECHKQAKNVLDDKTTEKFHWKGLRSDCLSCHKDFHHFANQKSKKFGSLSKCLTCHYETKWDEIRRFDHNRDTKFEISGKHINLDCVKCHKYQDKSKKVQIYHFPTLQSKNCEMCHKSPHKNSNVAAFKTRKCSECHFAEGWHVFKKQNSSFDHNKSTRFKLTGKHLAVSCNGCHVKGKKQIFKFEGVEKQFCSTCHNNVHRKQFDSKFNDQSCAECHTTGSFVRLKRFNHKSTNFSLTGRHAKTKCSQCHTPTEDFFPGKNGKAMSRFLFPENADKKYCASCHKNVHEDQFDSKFASAACIDCHTTKNFKRRKKFDHNTTVMPLLGKHLKINCNKCHVLTNDRFPPPINRKMRKFDFPGIDARDCVNCHRDVHRGNFGTGCTDCHVEAGWKVIRNFHKNFAMSGVHLSLECNECHNRGRKLGGMSQQCFVCHRQDDVHNGSLPQCGECHKEQFWENADFKHSRTSFPLRGVHRTMDCFECHRGGVYRGLPNECINCHQSDALSVANPPHIMPVYQDCAKCHNQFSF